jgi:hypothetical protein
MEQMPTTGGSSSEPVRMGGEPWKAPTHRIIEIGALNADDTRIRTGRLDSDEDDTDLVVKDPDMIPVSDSEPVGAHDGEPVQVSDADPTSTQESQTQTADEQHEQTQAAKKKGGRKGNKGGGQGGGGGNKADKKKKDEQSWDNPDKVHAAVDTWTTELIDLETQIETQEKLEEDDKPSIAMEKLEERKELLSKRLAKGKAKVALERKKQEMRGYEDDLVELLDELKKHKDNPPHDLTAEREQLNLRIGRARDELKEMMEAYARDFVGVTFDDEEVQVPRPTLYMDVPTNSEQKSSKLVKGVTGTAVVGGATIASMIKMAGGLIGDLWKSWRGHVTKPNSTFGGRGWRDFFWPPDKKKK